MRTRTRANETVEPNNNYLTDTHMLITHITFFWTRILSEIPNNFSCSYVTLSEIIQISCGKKSFNHTIMWSHLTKLGSAPIIRRDIPSQLDSDHNILLRPTDLAYSVKEGRHSVLFWKKLKMSDSDDIEVIDNDQEAARQLQRWGQNVRSNSTPRQGARGRILRRTFVHLRQRDRRATSIPRRRRLESLAGEWRIKMIEFPVGGTTEEVKTIAMTAMPSLAGLDRWEFSVFFIRFNSSNASG